MTAIAKHPFYFGSSLLNKFADAGDIVNVEVCLYSTNLLEVSNPDKPGFSAIIGEESAQSCLLFVPVVDVIEVAE